MATDLDSLASLSLQGQLRPAPLGRWRAGDWDTLAPLAQPLRIMAGQSGMFLAAVRHRFPIRNLRVGATVGADGVRVEAQAIGLAHFPEQSTALPDPLLGADGIDVPANSTQTFLVKIQTTPQAVRGPCRLRLHTESRSHDDTACWVDLEILPPARCACDRDEPQGPRVNFWPHWVCLARHYGVDLWSAPFWKLAQAYLRELAAGGMNVITAFVCEDPFRYPLPPAYYHFNHFPGMVGWRKRADGEFTFDYEVYDRYVQTCLHLGIDREIECHAMLPCKDQRPVLTYFDEALGRVVQIETRHDAPDYRSAWDQFLRSFAEHNQRRGWADLLSLCIYDEPRNIDSFRAVAEFVKARMPGLRITAAIGSDQARSLHEVLDIATLNASTDLADSAATLRRLGLEVRWYNCCVPAWANTLFECPLIDAYRLAWITEANDLAGYLRWSAFAWTQDPIRDPAFNWPTGDTCLLYPGAAGPLSSLRWEVYKLGRQDLAQAKAALAHADSASTELIHNLIQTLGRMSPFESEIPLHLWRERLGSLLGDILQESAGAQSTHAAEQPAFPGNRS